MLVGLNFLDDRTHIGGGSGNAQKSAGLVHEIVHIGNGQRLIALGAMLRRNTLVVLQQEGHHRRIHIAGAGAHDNTGQRRQSHAGIKALSVLHSGNGGAVAQMAGNDLGSLGLA